MSRNKKFDTTQQLEQILLKVYCKQTAYPKCASQWSEKNPCLGQCAVTALLVKHYFGGKIYKHNTENHYFNVIKGKLVDLTKSQFDYQIDYTNSKPKKPSLFKASTLKRYLLLKRLVGKAQKEQHV